jgi:hypothetical protein
MTRLWTVDIPRTTSRLIVAKQKMADDCRDFFNANGADLAVVGAEAAGIDFWLTRNRHGAGFWDRGLGNLGTRLTDAAQAFGECDLYVGDDGKLYLQPS